MLQENVDIVRRGGLASTMKGCRRSTSAMNGSRSETPPTSPTRRCIGGTTGCAGQELQLRLHRIAQESPALAHALVDLGWFTIYPGKVRLRMHRAVPYLLLADDHAVGEAARPAPLCTRNHPANE